MPSHIYFRLGDYHAAVLSNQRAFVADREAGKATGQFPAMGYHTREFLAAAAGMTGQGAVAREADDSLFVLLRFNRWGDVLARPRPDGGVSELEWQVARVLALVGLRRIQDADAVRTAYAAFETALPKDTEWWGDPVATFLPNAEQAFRDDLRLNPGSGRALFGLWKALAAQGRSSEAMRVERQFTEAWKNADTILLLEEL
jgi:hypothetical protein